MAKCPTLIVYINSGRDTTEQKPKIMTKTKTTTAGKTASFFTMLTLACGLLFTNCAKDGKTGPAGPAGANGTNGNANVVSSSITSSSWVYTAPSWGITFTYPAITQDIIDKGAVLVYLKVGSAYNQLPLTIYQSASYSSTYEVSTVVGGLTIFATDSDLTQPTNPGSKTFKVVVIAASGRAANPNVNYNDYNAVKKAFNLQD